MCVPVCAGVCWWMCVPVPRASFLGSRLVDCDSNSREGNLEKRGAVTVAANFKGGTFSPRDKEIDDGKTNYRLPSVI